MKRQFLNLAVIAIACSFNAWSQDQSVVERIVSEANENSQLEILGQELMDGIGPRLVGTPQMKQAHDWAVDKYSQWGKTGRLINTVNGVFQQKMKLTVLGGAGKEALHI